jgi:pyridoxamine 5'-phosphate oxidase-like protein
MIPHQMTAHWPETVDEVLAGDQAVAFAHVTPASGVVLTPLTNTGLRDRACGTATPVTSSVGMWRKLERLRANPRVAIAYHAREHGFSERPEYVLVQGTARLSPVDDRSWVERHRDAWERFSGPRDVGPLWERWLSVYHWRAAVSLDVERVAVWPDLRCRGSFAIHGEPLPGASPAPQRPPGQGTGPRIRHRRAARRAARRPHVLLGWVGADGFPVVVPVAVAGVEAAGILLSAPPRLVPPGGRRAGLLAHSFARHTAGQHQHKHTGWLEADGDRIVYAPHTESGYRLPESRTLYRLGAGFVTRRGARAARRAGFLAP